MNNTDIEAYLCEVFEENYERLRMEGGQPLSENSKQAALEQVLFYWRKLASLAQKVTETEVRLNLPEQITAKGRKYNIEGVVDIVHEDGQTTLYDIKTNDPQYIRANSNFYEMQLNIYAYIWQNLQNQSLDKTAVIATALPEALKEAIKHGDDQAIVEVMEQWEPIIDIPFDQQQIDDAIQDFGEVVDAIEDKNFAPPPVEKLTSKTHGTNTLWADRICGNCDARYSCSSHRSYITSSDC